MQNYPKLKIISVVKYLATSAAPRLFSEDHISDGQISDGQISDGHISGT